MLKKNTAIVSLLILSMVPLTGHALPLQSNFWQRHKTEVPLTDGIIRQETDIAPFSSIAIHGPFDVNIISRPQQHFLSYEGNGGLMSNVHYYVKDEVLHVFMNQEFAYTPNYRVTLNIEVDCLRRFSYRGPGKVEINDVNTDHLTLNLEENGYVYIAGRATRFDATVSGAGRLNAKFLYARTAFINTVEFAQAEIASNGSISALAADNSDIYYYDNPDLVAKYENTTGSIMRMQGLVEVSPQARALVPLMQPAATMAPQYLGKGPIETEEVEIIK